MIVVDPGAAGGIVIGDPEPFSVRAMPKTKREICDILHNTDPDTTPTLYLEELVKYAGTAMPGSAMAVYASNHGFIEGAATAYGYRVVMVPPKKWQSALGLGGRKSHPSKTAWKNHLKNRAEQLFPQIKVTLATADALLMYEAARRGFLG